MSSVAENSSKPVRSRSSSAVPEWITEVINGGSYPLVDLHTGTNGWASPPGDVFSLRSANYFTNKQKSPAGDYILSPAGVDWLKSSAKLDNLLARPDNRVAHALRKAQSRGQSLNSFIFAMNLQVPGKDKYSLVFYFATEEPIPHGSLLHRFINGDDSFRNQRFKSVMEVVKGPKIVKAALGNYGTLLLSKAVRCNYFRGSNYLEIDVDISSSRILKAVVRLALGYITNLTLDLGIVVQAETEDELPEKLIGAVRICQMELSSAVVVDSQPLQPSRIIGSAGKSDDEPHSTMCSTMVILMVDLFAHYYEFNYELRHSRGDNNSHTMRSAGDNSSKPVRSRATSAVPEWITEVINGGSFPLVDLHTGINGWVSPPGDVFSLRSANYFTNKQKSPAGDYILSPAGVDFFKSSAKLDNLLARPDNRVTHALRKAQSRGQSLNSFIFTVNLQIPSKYYYNLVSYFATEEPIPHGSLLHRFINGDDSFRNQRFKSVMEVVKGPKIVKAALGNYSTLLISKAVRCNYFRGSNYFEIDIDIGSSAIFKAIVRLAVGYITNLTFDLGIVVQAEAEDELPEKLIGAVRICQIELSSAVMVDSQPLKPTPTFGKI